MIDLSHRTQLPIICRLLDSEYHIPWSRIEAKSRTGETIDVLAFAERMTWLSDVCQVYAGCVLNSEFKSSIADLRKDEKKAWRKPKERAIGDLRLYWFHKDGEVRAEHVPDPDFIDGATGFGVVMFDEHSAELVREPRLYRNVDEWSQRLLLMRLQRQEYTQAASPSSSKAITRKATNKDLEAAIALIKEGPISYGQINKTLGLRGTKLLRDLERDSRVTQDGAGGAWKLKEQDDA